MSLIFATQLTAIATAALAAFAIVTAWYARRAFLKQSQEVSDQASMLQVQSEQLAEQRKVNAEQIRSSRSKRSSSTNPSPSASVKPSSVSACRYREYFSR